MVGVRSAARVESQIYAVGLDVGGTALEVAQRGFSSIFSNQMRHLGHWSAPGTDPALRLANDLIAAVAAKEVWSLERVAVGVAVPAWFGMSERRQLVGLLDPTGRYEVGCCSTGLAAALASNLTGARPLQSESVLCLDLGVGFGASLVSLDAGAVREVASVGVDPVRCAAARSARDGLAPALSVLRTATAQAGFAEVGRVLVVNSGTWDDDDVDEVIGHVDRSWSDRPLDVVGARGVVASGAALFIDLRGGLGLLGLRDAVDDEHLEVLSSCPHAIGVLADEVDAASSPVYVVIEQHATTPTNREEVFDLGPDDGSEVFLDVYEQQSLDASADLADHRLIMTARLRDAVARADELTVSFSVGPSGLLELGPAGAWSSTWYAGRVTMSSIPVAGRGDWVGAPDVASGEVRPMVESSEPVSRQVADRHHDVGPSPVTVGLADALLGFERVLSREVGHLVAVRSVYGLLGCPDGTEELVLRQRAHRLDELFVGRGDDSLAVAGRLAVHAAQRAMAVHGGRWYYGGSLTEIDAELWRIVEHLGVVVGVVSAAEQRRLVHDAQLLGLDRVHARSLVADLVTRSGVEVLMDEPAEPAGPAPADRLADRFVVVPPDSTSFELLPAGRAVASDAVLLRVVDSPD